MHSRHLCRWFSSILTLIWSITQNFLRKIGNFLRNFRGFFLKVYLELSRVIGVYWNLRSLELFWNWNLQHRSLLRLRPRPQNNYIFDSFVDLLSQLLHRSQWYLFYPFKRILHSYTHALRFTYIRITYTHSHACIHIHGHTYTNTYIHPHRYTYAHMHTHIHTCMHSCIHSTWIHSTWIHTSINIHIHTHMHTVFTYTYIVHAYARMAVHTRTKTFTWTHMST